MLVASVLLAAQMCPVQHPKANFPNHYPRTGYRLARPGQDSRPRSRAFDEMRHLPFRLMPALIGDTGKDVGEPSLRVDVIHFRRLCRPPNYAERFRFFR